MFKPHVFISYAHEDRRWFDNDSLMPRLIKALETLDRAEVWYDRRRLAGGDPWRKEIEDAIDRAQIAILLVSTSFIVSEFVRTVELPRIAQRAKEGQLVIIPILVGHCQWERLELLEGPQMIPGEPTPLVEYRESEAKWEKVQHEILSDIQRQIGKARNRARNKETVPDGPIAPSVPRAPPKSGLARPSTSTWSSRLSAGMKRLLYGASSEEQVFGEMAARLPSVTPDPQGRPVPVQRSTTGTPDATSSHVPESLDHESVGAPPEPTTTRADNPQSSRGDGMTARPGSTEVSPENNTIRSVQDRLDVASAEAVGLVGLTPDIASHLQQTVSDHGLATASLKSDPIGDRWFASGIWSPRLCPEPGISGQARVSPGAELRVLAEGEFEGSRWTRVRVADGREGWVNDAMEPTAGGRSSAYSREDLRAFFSLVHDSETVVGFIITDLHLGNDHYPSDGGRIDQFSFDGEGWGRLDIRNSLVKRIEINRLGSGPPVSIITDGSTYRGDFTLKPGSFYRGPFLVVTKPFVDITDIRNEIDLTTIERAILERAGTPMFSA